MAKCLNCDNEAVGRSRYCSDKCKVAYNRNKSVTNVTEISVTSETVTSLRSLSRQKLRQAIYGYPHDGWVNSLEHKELMRRLRSWDIDKLKSEGYFIPVWKYESVKKAS